LFEEVDADIIERLRAAENIGRPLGTGKFIDAIERKTRRVLKPAKRGPKPRVEAENKCTVTVLSVFRLSRSGTQCVSTRHCDPPSLFELRRARRSDLSAVARRAKAEAIQPRA
jgi:hypothetical protein